jgi:hypothetical protein
MAIVALAKATASAGPLLYLAPTFVDTLHAAIVSSSLQATNSAATHSSISSDQSKM